MRQLFLIAILFTSQCLNSQIPINGLVSYFSLNGNAVDDMNYQDGIIVGNVDPTTDRSGNPTCALSFDGTQSSLIFWQNFNEYDIHPDSSLSISLWYQGGSQDVGDYEVLFLKYGDGFNPRANPAYGLVLYDLNKVVMMGEYNNLWLSDNIIPIPDPNWHHLVGVFEVGHWKMYLDNVLVEEQQDTSAHVTQKAMDLVMGVGFEGSIDDLAFYDRAITTSEVNDIFNTPSACILGVNDLPTDLKVNIFPNPSAGILKIDLSNINVSEIEIYDCQGRLMSTKRINDTFLELDVSTFPSGVYSMSFDFENAFIGSVSFIVR